MKPSPKSPDLNALINTLFNVNRETAIRCNTCTFCGSDATTFRDKLSEREFAISGLCQACQDKVF